MHVDDCDVTFNFGLSSADDFEGNDLAFCGMLDSAEHRRHLVTYKHVKGRCVIHSGKRRHGALSIKGGERLSLIMWSKSDSFRQSPSYVSKLSNKAAAAKDAGVPDQVCLSYTHDKDYSRWAEGPCMYLVIRGKMPGVDIKLEVKPHFMVRDLAEILCYGVSHNGGSLREVPVQYRGIPPLAALM